MKILIHKRMIKNISLGGDFWSGLRWFLVGVTEDRMDTGIEERRRS